MRIRFIAALAIVLSCATPAFAQFTSVYGNQVGGAGHLVQNGTIYWQPVEAARIGTSSGQLLGVPVTATVVSGVFIVPANSVADTSLSNPPNTCYAVTVIDNPTGNVLLGAGLASDGVHVNTGGPYGCVQPSGMNWNFDTYSPAAPPTAMVVAGPPGPQGPLGPTGPPGGSLSYPGVSSDANSGLFLGATHIVTGEEVGVACNGNVTTALAAALSTLASEGGGTVKLSSGSCYDTAQLPFTAGGSYRITGMGSQAGSLISPLNEPTGTLLDLQYATGPKIYATGIGYVEVDHVGFEDTVDGTWPFIYTSNTVLNIHENSFQGLHSACCVSSPAMPTQDAIVLGGPGTSPLFQGYGTKIENNQFAGIRSIVVANSEANSIIVKDNTGTVLDGGVCAVRIGVSGGQVQGATIRDNLIEMPAYNYGFCISATDLSTFSSNSLWDSNAGPITAATNANPVVFTASSSEGNMPLVGAELTLSGFTGGWAGLNGTVQTVTAASSTTFTIAVNSLSFGTFTGTASWNMLMGDYTADSASFDNLYEGAFGDAAPTIVVGAGSSPCTNTIIDPGSGGLQQTCPIIGRPATHTPGTLAIYSDTTTTQAALLALEQLGGGTFVVGPNYGSLYFALNPSCTLPSCTPTQLAAAALLTLSAGGLAGTVPFSAPSFATGSGTAQSAGYSMTTAAFPTYGNELAFLQPGAANFILFQNANIMYFSLNPSCTYPNCTPTQAAAASIFTLNGAGTSSVATPFAVDSGTNVIYRCTTAGTLRVGELTSVAADCGASVDSGLRTQ